MQQSSIPTLWHALNRTEDLSSKFLFSARACVALASVAQWSALHRPATELHNRSVLVYTSDQLTTALVLVALDGIARRLIICPSDVPVEHLPVIAELAEVDALVSDLPALPLNLSTLDLFTCRANIIAAEYNREAPIPTEWVLLTSGTTGIPKLVVHTFSTLTAPIEIRPVTSQFVWSTFYDIRRYGGLQIFLRAVVTGTSLVLSDGTEHIADFLNRAGAHGVTHISGTPSHWRRALMSPAANRIAPQYVRLSGEIADQAILNQLQSFYPKAPVAHAFASTEAGVGFEVNDGLAGVPAKLIDDFGKVHMKVEQGSLRIRSDRAAQKYLGATAPLADSDGFIDTGDMLDRRGDRYYFAGRRDGVINIGGAKVHPEEVEAVINRHPQVRMSLVHTRKSPITGALVVADVVLTTPTECADENERELQQAILLLCRNALPAHKVPATIKIVPSLPVAETGKMMRAHA